MEASRDELARFFEVVLPHLNELQRRVVAGAMAEALGRGGKTAVAEASGMSRNTVIKAEREVSEGIEPSDRQRAPGGGDIKSEDKQPGLLEALDELVHPETRGNPMSYMRWTSKSTGKLANELVRQGYKITDDTVGRILKSLGYSLQAPSKQKEGTAHPDRDAQFNYLNKQVGAFMKAGQPVISVDTKKKELVGEFSNGGGEWHPTGEPTRTKTHDFVDKELGRAVPYGVYDLANDEGWVSVGDTADTASFAVEAIRRWWYSMGQAPVPRRHQALDHRRCRRVQRLSGQAVEGRVGHAGRRDRPRDHRLPLPTGNLEVEQDRAQDVQLHLHELARSTPRLVSDHHRADLEHDDTKGLKIRAEEDFNYYETGTKVSDAELAAVPLTPPQVPRRLELHDCAISQSVSP